MNWYTSDTHAYHKSVIKHNNRPFDDAITMTEALAKNINERVEKNDRLIHLGDWSFGPKHNAKQQLRNAISFREMINCQNVILVFGNHDYLRENDAFLKLFLRTGDIIHYKDDVLQKNITLCHYAFRVWNKSHYGQWHLYGHSHGHLPDNDTFSFDVGVDCHNYKPINSLEVESIMKRKLEQGVRPVLHHLVK